VGYVDAGPERFSGGLGAIEVAGDVQLAALQAETNRLGKHYNSKGWTLGPVPNLPLKIDGNLGSKTTAAVRKTAELMEAFHGPSGVKDYARQIGKYAKAITAMFREDADDWGLAPAPEIELLMAPDYVGGKGKIGARAPQVATMPLTFILLGGFGLWFLFFDKPKKRRR
jgi:hypothetical protein